MPRKTRYADQPITNVAGRAEFILREVYHGDQSKMAAETGISQPQISLVVGGKRSPGERFIAGLAKVPGINIEWLTTGVGEPFAPFACGGSAGGRTVAANRLLPAARLAGGPRRPAFGGHFPNRGAFLQRIQILLRDSEGGPRRPGGTGCQAGRFAAVRDRPCVLETQPRRAYQGNSAYSSSGTGSGMVCVLAQAKPFAGRPDRLSRSSAARTGGTQQPLTPF